MEVPADAARAMCAAGNALWGDVSGGPTPPTPRDKLMLN